MAKPRKPKAKKTSSTPKGRYTYCPNCGSRRLKNNHCDICGRDNASKSKQEPPRNSEKLHPLGPRTNGDS